jgi:hypothetical protein
MQCSLICILIGTCQTMTDELATQLISEAEEHPTNGLQFLKSIASNEYYRNFGKLVYVCERKATIKFWPRSKTYIGLSRKIFSIEWCIYYWILLRTVKTDFWLNIKPIQAKNEFSRYASESNNIYTIRYRNFFSTNLYVLFRGQKLL